MIYQGKAIQCFLEEDGIAHLKFENLEGGANIFNALALRELSESIKALKEEAKVKGLLISSGKDHFVLGADIFEFLEVFKMPASEMEEWLKKLNDNFNKIEDLDVPSVVAIGGQALGGGLEVCLTGSYRIGNSKTKIGLPETKLGIYPGWGGTVRLSRLAGVDNALEWITSGKTYSAQDALKVGALDGIVERDEELLNGARNLLKRAINGELDWKKRQEIKKTASKIPVVESTLSFEMAKGMVLGMAGKNYPAPLKVIEVIQKGISKTRDEALAIEGKGFVEVAKGDVAENLVTLFLGDQFLKKKSKGVSKGAQKIQKAAVLGAGIMGGGIAYQSASKGIPIVMKDIQEQALDQGLQEASGLLGKLVKRKKIDVPKMGQILGSIRPTLSYGDFDGVQMVVEAVTENLNVKTKVLKDLEKNTSDTTFIASNTSTIPITELAKDLKRPENFCGMHFFNPVHRMPLVEVIKGEKTSPEALAHTVAYAVSLGKTPIVVNDCPGFLVNRVLFPYFNGFLRLVRDGVDLRRIDKVMEKFGWPMGPAYLIDVVGIDTGLHAYNVMAKSFPDRMDLGEETIFDGLVKANRLGQKNGVGIYEYKKDKKGKLKKSYDEEIENFLAPYIKQEIQISDEEILERMMFPMIFECARCLEEKIVETPQEVDMGLILGLGFPPFRAGALKFADSIGLRNILERNKNYEILGGAYSVPNSLEALAQENKSFYRDPKGGQNE